MKVKLTESRATVKDGETVAQHAGETVDLPNEEAKGLLNSGAAVPVARKKVDQAEKR